MLVYLHGGIICVQQDIRLRYHKSNQDYYFISHMDAPKSSLHMHMENKRGLTKGTEQTLEPRKLKTHFTSCLSAVETLDVPGTRHTGTYKPISPLIFSI